MDLSIVVPCYNEEGSLPLLFGAVVVLLGAEMLLRQFSKRKLKSSKAAPTVRRTCCMSCPLLHRLNVSSWSIFPATSARKAPCSQAFNMPKGMRLA